MGPDGVNTEYGTPLQTCLFLPHLTNTTIIRRRARVTAGRFPCRELESRQVRSQVGRTGWPAGLLACPGPAEAQGPSLAAGKPTRAAMHSARLLVNLPRCSFSGEHPCLQSTEPVSVVLDSMPLRPLRVHLCVCVCMCVWGSRRGASRGRGGMEAGRARDSEWPSSDHHVLCSCACARARACVCVQMCAHLGVQLGDFVAGAARGARQAAPEREGKVGGWVGGWGSGADIEGGKSKGSAIALSKQE
jgi:hypothetical protein